MAITVQSDLTSAATTAYNLQVFDTLRADAVYSTSMIQTVQATNLSHRGDTVRFWFRADLAAAVTPLTENADVTAQSISDAYVDVAIAEYGAATGTTDAVTGTTMIPVDMMIGQANANQATDSFDQLARTALMGGTQVKFEGQTAQASITATDTAAGASIHEIVAKLRNQNVRPIGDGKYLGIFSPYTSLDLRSETGDQAWVTSRNYQDLSGINDGFMGTWGGVMFYDTSRVPLLADAGASAVDVYQNVIVGQEALAKAYSQNVSGPAPEAVVSPQTDLLKRFNHVGWKWFGGFDTFRQEACYRYETASSIGANT